MSGRGGEAEAQLHARTYDEDASRYRVKAIGDFGALTANERFVAARRAAEEFAELIETGGFKREKIETIKAACLAYADGRPDAEGDGAWAGSVAARWRSAR